MHTELDWNENRMQFRAVLYRGEEVCDVTPWMVPATRRWWDVPAPERWYSHPLRGLCLWDALGLWSVLTLVLLLMLMLMFI